MSLCSRVHVHGRGGEHIRTAVGVHVARYNRGVCSGDSRRCGVRARAGSGSGVWVACGAAVIGEGDRGGGGVRGVERYGVV